MNSRLLLYEEGDQGLRGPPLLVHVVFVVLILLFLLLSLLLSLLPLLPERPFRPDACSVVCVP